MRGLSASNLTLKTSQLDAAHRIWSDHVLSGRKWLTRSQRARRAAFSPTSLITATEASPMRSDARAELGVPPGPERRRSLSPGSAQRRRGNCVTRTHSGPHARASRRLGRVVAASCMPRSISAHSMGEQQGPRRLRRTRLLTHHRSLSVSKPARRPKLTRVHSSHSPAPTESAWRRALAPNVMLNHLTPPSPLTRAGAPSQPGEVSARPMRPTRHRSRSGNVIQARRRLLEAPLQSASHDALC